VTEKKGAKRVVSPGKTGPPKGEPVRQPITRGAHDGFGTGRKSGQQLGEKGVLWGETNLQKKNKKNTWPPGKEKKGGGRC